MNTNTRLCLQGIVMVIRLLVYLVSNLDSSMPSKNLNAEAGNLIKKIMYEVNKR